MTAALGKLLVFEVQGGDAAALVLADGAADVQDAAVAGVGVGDDGNVYDGGNLGGVVQHLGHGCQRQVGVAETRYRSACAGHVDGGEAGGLDQLGGEAVVSAGGHDDARLFQ